ncbi:hypothetical protein [Aliidiomarina indica]|uniref:hypothetical protein n=1 Tax=Aliidiomarina indica TaxID=2749147 RepID=UPI00188FAB27|nr:hypothetical protein [Aliidiomarina indica]
MSLMKSTTHRILFAAGLGAIIALSGCTTTETSSQSQNIPTQAQQQRTNPEQPRSSTPSLAHLTYQNADFHLIVNRTTMSDVQRWWGPAHGRGHSGEFMFLNYTDVMQDDVRSRMLMMTLYFSPQGLLQDYDLQIHEFEK